MDGLIQVSHSRMPWLKDVFGAHFEWQGPVNIYPTVSGFKDTGILKLYGCRQNNCTSGLHLVDFTTFKSHL
jgi:hypothetical protein